MLVRGRGVTTAWKYTRGAVEETIAGFDRIVDGLGAGVIVDLPQTETHQGHFMSAIELDSLSCCHGCESSNRAVKEIDGSVEGMVTAGC